MKTFILSFIFSVVFTKIVIPILSKYKLDKPNKRSSHNFSKPTSGGIVFTVISIVFTFNTNNFINLICLPLSLIGFLDDKYNLSLKLRYFFQLGTVISLIIYGIFNQEINTILSKEYNPLVFLLIFILFVLIGTTLINFINFMDGIDGLVCSNLLFIFCLIALRFNLPLIGLIGSLAGFLVWNWDPSKIFMGDSGSTFLGSVLAGIILNFESWIDIFDTLILASPLLLDAFICLFRRLFSGKNIFEAHRLHLYQRLTQAGIKHSKVTLIYLASTGFISISYLTFSTSGELFSILLVLLLGVWLENKKSVPFKECI